MLNFELYIPTKLYFGRGQCGRVGEICLLYTSPSPRDS